MPNRLAQASSPYLQQHADNPVDWFEWGQEAWAKATSENKPVFLSVGYSSCHWCHVMAHESFEDPEIAEVLNRHFVNIKLDREERPDIDDVYMTAVQLATGHGGWPMSVFLTPDKKPFFAGTYFPRHARGDYPSFLTLLTNLAEAWKEENQEILAKADEFAQGLAQVLERDIAPVTRRLDVGLLDQAMQHFHSVFDYENGGFGERPKFPPHALLQFIAEYAYQRPRLPGDPNQIEALTNDAGHMLLLTLEKMTAGGIHDHVGGGFHRYATDEHWLLPHFEKMLYDNAQILSVYAQVIQMVEEEGLKVILQETAEQLVHWTDRQMTTPDGLFASALDADSPIAPDGETEEGAYYVWSLEEIQHLFGRDATAHLAEIYNLRPEGNFHDEATGTLTGKNILHQTKLQDRDPVLDFLLQARDNRPRPGLDHKAVAAYNGLMIGALAQSGHLPLAIRAANVWASYPPEQLPHQIVHQKPEGRAFLDDVAYLADAYLDLYKSTNDPAWLDQATNLADHMVKHFADSKRGGFTYTASFHERLFGQTKPAMDNATPSPNGVALRVLRRLGRHDEALVHLTAVIGWAQRLPQASATILAECLQQLLHAGETSLAPEIATEIGLQAHLVPHEIQVAEDGFGYAELQITIPEGHHINSHDPSANWLIPTSVQVENVYGEAGFPDSPSGRYEGLLTLPLRLKPKKGTDEFQITLSYQLCTETECFAPAELQLYGVLIQPN